MKTNPVEMKEPKNTIVEMKNPAISHLSCYKNKTISKRTQVGRDLFTTQTDLGHLTQNLNKK